MTVKMNARPTRPRSYYFQTEVKSQRTNTQQTKVVIVIRCTDFPKKYSDKVEMETGNLKLHFVSCISPLCYVSHAQNF